MKVINYKGSIEDFLKDFKTFDRVISNIDSDLLLSRRWFRRKNVNISKVKVFQNFYIKPKQRDKIPFCLLFIEVTHVDKVKQNYFLPLSFEKKESVEAYFRVKLKDGVYCAVDAFSCNVFLEFIYDLFEKKSIFKGKNGTLVFEDFGKKQKPYAMELDTGSTNTIISYSTTSKLKISRSLEEGANVEYEIGEYLSLKEYPNSRILEGSINFVDSSGGLSKVGIKFGESHYLSDMWDITLMNLKKFIKSVSSNSFGVDNTKDYLGDYADDIRRLAHTVALLHSTLCKEKEHPRFASEKFTKQDVYMWRDSVLDLAKSTIDDAQKFALDNPSNTFISEINLPLDLLSKYYERVLKYSQLGERTRVHGDLHLGQILKTEDSFMLIDFEGEPLRPVDQRALKYSPLKDIASLMRSFHYASMFELANIEETKMGTVRPYVHKWYEEISKHFFRSYLEWARKLRCSSVPYGNLDVVRLILALYKLEKAIYELKYEINNRPSWAKIAVEGIKICIEEIESQ